MSQQRQSQQRQSQMLTPEEENELQDVFKGFDRNDNGFIDEHEIGEALAGVGMNTPGYQLRTRLVKYVREDSDQKLSYEEFEKLYKELKSERDYGKQFKQVISSKQGIETHGGSSEASVEGTTHSVKPGEQAAFEEWINRHLHSDPDCKWYMPVDKDLFKKVKDGILLCKLINHACPETIDERVLNKRKSEQDLSLYKRIENQVLAVNSAKAVGCSVTNIGPDDIEKGKPHLVLGLIWQVIRIGLLSQISLVHHPKLMALLMDGESKEDLLRLSPDQILIRWVNYHLDKAECGLKISNFGDDIKDSAAYSYLLHRIAPREAGVTRSALDLTGNETRAEQMLKEADKIGCRSFVGPKEVSDGHTRLNLAFVANLFNNYPALDTEEEFEEEIIEESREDKTYRNWMNSLGVNPTVHYLFCDLCDGLVFFQLYDIIQPGIVDWKRVVKKFSSLKMNFEKLDNCNHVTELGKKCNFSLVGIAGSDLKEGNKTLTLALVWQLMRAYTMAILNKISKKVGRGEGNLKDADILNWADEKLKSVGKSYPKLRGFQDSSLSDGLYILDLIEAIKPGAINKEVIRSGGSDEDKLSNAKYAISMARKIGATVYALPEDIVECKQKMIMTIFACLMHKDYSNLPDAEQE